jgi:hypothetical protein
MNTSLIGPTPRLVAGTAALLLALTAGCGGKQAPSTTDANPAAAAPATPAATAGAAATPPAPLQASTATWTPEALEQLLAPVALYPDVVLVQVLTAATNPQEVLDAGNWLIANASLTGKAREDSAQQAGFTPPVRGLMQSPEVIDKMCLNMGWTEEVGQAYVNDQAGVTSAVQRLRAQAKDVGTLASSDKLKVETVAAAAPSDPPVIKIEPPSPQVVYVPQYDPVAAYAPAPASTAAPTAATTTTTTTTAQSGHSTGTLVTTGLLSFGAGILVANIFDDDDDDYWSSSYYGNMWSRPMPYYPPYPYRPVYGNGFYPGYGYNRPPSWGNNGWGNNNTIIINQDNDYWNRWGNDDSVLANRREPRSPITAAKPNRPELRQLNADAAKGPKRPGPSAAQTAEWKGQKGYAGADPAKRAAATSAAATARDRAAVNPGATAGARDRVAAAPKVQGTYAGARPANAASATRPVGARLPTGPASGSKVAPTARPAGYDRGRVADAAERRPTAASRPAYSPESRPARPAYAQESRPPRPAYSPGSGNEKPTFRPATSPDRAASRAPRPAPSRTAITGADRGGADRAASARGRASTGGKVPVQSRQAAAARQPRGR